MSGLLAGRVAVVSGIGPGLGREVACALAREGADLVLAARTPARLAEVAEAVRAAGRRVLSVPTDVTRAEDRAALAEQIRAHHGRVDVLVNNAFDMGPMKPLAEAGDEDLLRPLHVNLIGSLQLTRALLPLLRAGRGASIVMINSMVVREVLPNMGPYAASKAALLAASQALARELGPEGIRVNSVLPGYIWGPSLKAWFAHQARERGVDPQQIYDETASHTALRRLPTPEEIADAVVFFASDLARVITGQSLDVNAGHVLC